MAKFKMTPIEVANLIGDIELEMSASDNKIRFAAISEIGERYGVSYERMKDLFYSLSYAADRTPLRSVPKKRRKRSEVLRKFMDAGLIDKAVAKRLSMHFFEHSPGFDIERLSAGFSVGSRVQSDQIAVVNNVHKIARMKMLSGSPRARAYAEAWQIIGKTMHQKITGPLKKGVSREIIQDNLPLIWESAVKLTEASKDYTLFNTLLLKWVQKKSPRGVYWDRTFSTPEERDAFIRKLKVKSLPVGLLHPFLSMVKAQPGSKPTPELFRITEEEREQMLANPEKIRIVDTYLESLRKTLSRRFKPGESETWGGAYNIKRAIEETDERIRIESKERGEPLPRGFLGFLRKEAEIIARANASYDQGKRIEERMHKDIKRFTRSRKRFKG